MYACRMQKCYCFTCFTCFYMLFFFQSFCGRVASPYLFRINHNYLKLLEDSYLFNMNALENKKITLSITLRLLLVAIGWPSLVCDFIYLLNVLVDQTDCLVQFPRFWNQQLCESILSSFWLVSTPGLNWYPVWYAPVQPWLIGCIIKRPHHLQHFHFYDT